VELVRESSLEKVLEAAISYEQVLLSQISYCAKLTNLISYNYDYGDDIVYESDNEFSLEVCVSNLISLVPRDLRLKFFDKEKEIKKKILDYANNYECIKNDNCEDNELDVIASEIRKKLSKELPEYSHLIGFLIDFLVIKKSKYSFVKYLQFQLALIVDLLIEEGIIGLKRSSLFVGRVDVLK